MSELTARRPGDTSPPSLGHVALHLAKEAGLLASAIEKMEHAAERAEGEALLKAWLLNRANNLERIERLVAAHFHGKCSNCGKSWNAPEAGKNCPFCGSWNWGANIGRLG